MYLLLLLLISPAFGMPQVNIPGGKEKISHLDSLPRFTEKTADIFKNSKMYEKIAKDLKEAEKDLIELNGKLKSFSSKYDQLRGQKDYFPLYNQAKQNLRESRQGLRELAFRTVSEVRDLRNLLIDLDKSKDPVLLKVSILKMKNLMIETLETLKEALEKYNSARLAFVNLNDSIQTTITLLVEIVDEKTPTACKELDSNSTGFKYFVYHARCVTPRWWKNQIYPSIPKLRKITNKMTEKGKLFDRTIQQAIDILTEEIDQITEWSVRADVVNKNIDYYRLEHLEKYNSIRENFKVGLDDLSEAALLFLTLPSDILA